MLKQAAAHQAVLLGLHQCWHPSHPLVQGRLHLWVACLLHHSHLYQLAGSLTGPQAYQASHQSLVLAHQLVLLAVSLDSQGQLRVHQGLQVCWRVHLASSQQPLRLPRHMLLLGASHSINSQARAISSSISQSALVGFLVHRSVRRAILVCHTAPQG